MFALPAQMSLWSSLTTLEVTLRVRISLALMSANCRQQRANQATTLPRCLEWLRVVSSLGLGIATIVEQQTCDLGVPKP